MLSGVDSSGRNDEVKFSPREKAMLEITNRVKARPTRPGTAHQRPAVPTTQAR